MSNLIPQPMSKDTLLLILQDIASHIDANDSFEGWFNYTIPDDYKPGESEFEVTAGYRVGNSQGQGGFRMIGTVPPVTEA